MRERKWSKTILGLLKEQFLAIALFVIIFASLIAGLDSARVGSDEEELRIVQESISRAIVSCYAIEGAYPESFEYLKENYNLHINEDKYVVKYSIFASNMMPSVTVIEVDA